MKFFKPKNYKTLFDYIESENSIKLVKDTFEKKLASQLNLVRVSAPLFVEKGSGLNDELNGYERSVSFDILETGKNAEIVHSLAKWKRKALGDYNFPVHKGLYTDMNAIRRDENLSNLHSIYVDQWDWEKIILKEERNIETLKDTVVKIVKALKETEDIVRKEYPMLEPIVSEEVTFITSEELLQKYPELSPKEREHAFAREKKTICILQIGKKLSDGSLHDTRSADYDDWEMNCDILIYYPLLDISVEISSMGVRVDEESLVKQLKEKNQEEKLKLSYHTMLLNGELPYTIGGGIGQSRICLLILNRAHIGEVQASIWDDETKKLAEENGIKLL